MADGARARLLLIVTGSSLRAEEADRPLAYYLKQQAEAQFQAAHDDDVPSRVWVVSDLRWLGDEPLQGLPTIALGGPGVNDLTRQWIDEIPLSLAVDGRYFIQMDPELDRPRASIWGMDNPDTQIAVSAFVQRFLPRFLENCTTVALDPSESDADADADDED